MRIHKMITGGKMLLIFYQIILISFLTLQVPIVTNINFLLTIYIHCDEIRL